METLTGGHRVTKSREAASPVCFLFKPPRLGPPVRKTGRHCRALSPRTLQLVFALSKSGSSNTVTSSTAPEQRGCFESDLHQTAQKYPNQEERSRSSGINAYQERSQSPSMRRLSSMLYAITKATFNQPRHCGVPQYSVTARPGEAHEGPLNQSEAFGQGSSVSHVHDPALARA